MKKIFVIATMLIAAMSMQAQEKAMKVEKTDGTNTLTRVADLKEITFLTIDEGGQGLMVKTLEGETAKVLFETHPVVTISKGKLHITSASADALEFEISDIAEILFSESSNNIKGMKGLECVMLNGAALLRGIPEGIKPQVFALDGHCIPTPHFTGGELLLNREALGKGVFIVKVGSLSTKIKL